MATPTKRSCKTTFDQNHLTVKVRFRDEFSSVQGVVIYDLNDKNRSTDEVNWLAYGQLPHQCSHQPQLIQGQKTIAPTKNSLFLN